MGLHVRAETRPGETLDHQAIVAIWEAQGLEDPGHGTDLIQLVWTGLVDGLFGDGEAHDGLFALQEILDQALRSFLADQDRYHCFGEDDRVPDRQHGDRSRSGGRGLE